MKPQIDAITATLRRGECIGLDAEFTGASEMLELSVYDLSLEVIFESLFRPARSQRWSKVPHGITPAMVKGKCHVCSGSSTDADIWWVSLSKTIYHI